MTITSYGIDTVNNITNQIISDVSILYYILSGLILKHLVNHHILFVHYSWVRSFFFSLHKLDKKSTLGS